MIILYNKEMTGMEIGIIVTVGVIIVNLLIFSFLPIGIKKIMSRGKSKCLPK